VYFINKIYTLPELTLFTHSLFFSWIGRTEATVVAIKIWIWIVGMEKEEK
jgi:hypothetical protein